VTFLELLGIWVAVASTLFILSFLYKDNPLYRLAEHVFVGVSIGYSVALAVMRVLIPDWWELIFSEGKYWLIIPGLLGILALTRLVRKYSWLSRIAFAFIMGFTSGVAIPTAVDAFVLKHSSKTISPLIQRTAEGNIDFSIYGIFAAFSDLLVIVLVICTLVYFFFSIEHRGPIKIAARGGILFLMVAFGIAYGNTVMGRMSLLYNRFYELKAASGKESYYATPVLLFAVVVFLAILAIIRWLRRDQGPQGSQTS